MKMKAFTILFYLQVFQMKTVKINTLPDVLIGLTLDYVTNIHILKNIAKNLAIYVKGNSEN